MRDQDYICGLTAKHLFRRCIGEALLKEEVSQRGQRRKCCYCGRTARPYTIGELAKRVEMAFEQHYYHTSNQPTSWQQMLLSDRESDYEWERDGESVV